MNQSLFKDPEYAPELESEYDTGDQAFYWRRRRGATRSPSWSDVARWRARWTSDLVSRVIALLGTDRWETTVSKITDFEPLEVVDEFGRVKVVPDLRGFDVVLVPPSQRHVSSAVDLSYHRLEGARLTGMNLSGANLLRANLRKATLRRSIMIDVDLTKADLSDADLREARLNGANLAFAQYTRDGIWWRGTVLMETHLAEASYVDPVFERDAKDQYFLYAWRYRNRHRWTSRVAFFFWRWSSNYGSSFGLFAIWSAVIACIFAAIYHYLLLPSELVSANDLPHSYWRALYFSVVTITTLGFGDVSPASLRAAWIVSTEVVIGYIMLGGLISIFASKVARRS